MKNKYNNIIKLKKEQHAMFHTHYLNEEEINYIITKLNAVHFLNERIKYNNKCYNNEDLNKYEFIRKEFKILESLKNKLDIWEEE